MDLISNAFANGPTLGVSVRFNCKQNNTITVKNCKKLSRVDLGSKMTSPRPRISYLSKFNVCNFFCHFFDLRCNEFAWSTPGCLHFWVKGNISQALVSRKTARWVWEWIERKQYSRKSPPPLLLHGQWIRYILRLSSKLWLHHPVPTHNVGMASHFRCLIWITDFVGGEMQHVKQPFRRY